MEISGTVIKILGTQKFVSQKNGNEYVKNTFVIETQGNYPKKIAFSVMGAEKFAQMSIQVGRAYNVQFDIESREWQERWFTECQAWRAVRMDGQQAAAPAPAANAGTTTGNAPSAPAPTSAAADDNGGQEDSDNLPF